jgi:hypothetical protein
LTRVARLAMNLALQYGRMPLSMISSFCAVARLLQ